MIFRKKLIGKILAIVLAFLLWINPLVVPIIWAEETVPPESQPAETQTQPEVQPTQDLTPTSTPESSITTGDASSQAEVETTANTNQDIIPGEITTPPGDCSPPEGGTSCPEDVVIKNDNLAGVSDTATSSATTGDNLIQGSSGDATITTGDATASGTIENEVNSNTIILEPTVTSIPTVEPATEEQTLTVSNNNEGTVENEANVSAQTGQNLASENLGDVQIGTGDALAWANLFNLLNLNIVGSNFELLLLNLLNGQGGEVNLNELWKLIQEKQGTDSLSLAGEANASTLVISVQNQNQANLENNVAVSADTGENQANQNNNVGIQTGNATALANVTNIVNTNILGSKFFFGVVNILDSETGDLILPRPEIFNSQGGGLEQGQGVIFQNQNTAEISDQVAASAQTGNNQENNNSGDNLITTGNAWASVNSFSLVNLNIRYNNWFFLIINNLGNWTGKIFGWSGSEAVEEPEEGSQVYQLGLNGETQTLENGVEPDNSSTSLTFENQNQATVRNNIQTQASTGGNQANGNQGNTSIETGNARSLANLFNLVNLNILGGRFFMGLVNILGDWSGNTIFAYPDLVVTISDGEREIKPGDTLEYTLCVQNQGYDEAVGVSLRFSLPAGMIYLGDSSGLVPQVSGEELRWSVGGLSRGGQKCFQVKVQLEASFSPPIQNNEISFWDKIIPKAYAAENQTTVTVEASVWTPDPESNTSNNSTSETTSVWFPQVTGEDMRQPVLEISAWNNVNDFVYPGDTVTFEITVKNTSDVPSYNTRLVQKLYNGVPEDFGTAEFDLGTIEPGKGGKLSFGLKLADDGLLPTGAYYTIAQAFGNAPNGNLVSSNEAKTNFKIRLREISSLFEAKAVEKEEGEILGEESAQCAKTEDVLPYVLLLLLSSAYIVFWTKPRLKKEVK